MSAKVSAQSVGGDSNPLALDAAADSVVDSAADSAADSRDGDGFYLPCLAVIGVGMIGGSLALGLKREKAVGRVIGVDLPSEEGQENLRRAVAEGVIDEGVDGAGGEAIVRAVAAADMVVLAVPVGALGEVFGAIAPALDAEKIVTDVGSVKGGVCEVARARLQEKIARFVPGHPVAGKEHSGVAAASAGLFQNHNVVLTPMPQTAPRAMEVVAQMWRAVGATVCTMSVAQHDRVLSLTSHLPHVLAYAMVDFFANFEECAEAYDMAAGGFYDFSRTVSSNTEMWRDICLMNREQILEHTARFRKHLARVEKLIKTDDAAGLQRLFADAKRARSRVAERRQS